MADFSIHSTDHDDIVLVESLPGALTYQRLEGALVYQLHSGFGDMVFQEFKGNGFTIWFSHYLIRRPVTLIARGDIPVLELQIPLQDNFQSDWDGFGRTALKNGQFEMSYAPFISNKAMMRALNYRTFDIHYELSFLESFAEQFPPLGEFINKVLRKEPVHLFGAEQFMTTDLYPLVKDMTSQRYSGVVAARFYESAVTILLIKILERLSLTVTVKSRITPKDVEHAMEAKRIILSDFEQFHTIQELTRMVGTNMYKLKTAFKQVHGISIFKFSQQARIEFAKRLLLETDYTLQTIAELVGYTEGNNFQDVFKRLTGMTPGVFRKRVNR